ncbi:MAG: hypothetical protein LBU62_06310 [Bacteroidales bacterium]|jgi:hypothetical protein|nr:hypothetical protein [Bacteroidales bacterium]
MARPETKELAVRIVAKYDFNGGNNRVASNYAKEYTEIERAIGDIDATQFKTKISKERTMPGRKLFSPSAINEEFRKLLEPMGWKNHRVNCDYQYGEFLDNYIPPAPTHGQFRDMDFVKYGIKLGIEVQFGKYAFMVYNVCAKMTIFRNLGIIDTGIEIVPVKRFADEMSTGVSYFEQFAWDLKQRGVSNIDIPVLILGIDA